MQRHNCEQKAHAMHHYLISQTAKSPLEKWNGADGVSR